jgi:transposase
MSDFRPINREMDFLMPSSVDEWLPQRHLARFVVEVIEGLDLRAMTGSYRGSGEASYHPQRLLGLIIYGYATGMFSSRNLERATYDSVAFRFIAANEHPDHDTIAIFRRRFLKQIEARFVQALGVAREMGVLKLGTVALDGTKIHANASRQGGADPSDALGCGRALGVERAGEQHLARTDPHRHFRESRWAKRCGGRPDSRDRTRGVRAAAAPGSAHAAAGAAGGYRPGRGLPRERRRWLRHRPGHRGGWRAHHWPAVRRRDRRPCGDRAGARGWMMPAAQISRPPIGLPTASWPAMARYKRGVTLSAHLAQPGVG